MGSEPKPVKDTNPISIEITVKENTLNVEPDSVTLSISCRDEAKWQCRNGDLEILFNPNDTPFDTHHFTALKGESRCSGVPRAGAHLPRAGMARPQPYKYTVIVTMGERSYHKDPDVIVKG